MSVIVKGMEMPENCNKCKLQHTGLYWCNVAGKRTSHIDSDTGKPLNQAIRPDWCPLVEVPTPHGRLIDADAFEKDNAYFWGRDFINAKYEDCLCDLVNAAPTIIEAEGET